MVALSRNRCGCDCLNEVSTSEGTATNCAAVCPKTTCNYVLLAECEYYVTNTGTTATDSGAMPWYQQRELMLEGFTILRKDCVQGATWSSRWVLCEIVGPVDGVNVPSGILMDFPYLKCQDPHVWFDPLNMAGALSADEREELLRERVIQQASGPDWGAPFCLCCHWEGSSPEVDDVYNPSNECCSPQNVGGQPIDGFRIALDDACFIKWEMEIGGTNAAIRGISRDGREILYYSSDFHCVGQSTFACIETTRPAGFESLPHHLCVTSVALTDDATDDRDDTSCADATQECDCCLDFDCGLPLYITTCPGEPPVKVTLGRNVELPCGVSDPANVCDYFGGSVTCPNSGSLYFLAFCTGANTWDVKVYCLIDACYVEQSCSISGLSCECAGIHFTLSCAAYTAECECCGEPTCECCTEEELPTSTTLFAEDGFGNTITLTWGGAQWVGSLPVGTTWGNCAPSPDELLFQFFCGPDFCYTFDLINSFISCVGPQTSCDPFEWTGVCSAGYPSFCGTPFTVTVHE